MSVKDGSMTRSAALPNGANTTQTSGVDLGGSSRGHLPLTEFQIDSPALTTSQLGDGQILRFDLQHSDASDFTGAETLFAIGTQVGAGGEGAAALSKRNALPSGCKRYVRAAAVKSGASNASAASFILSFWF